MAAMVNIAVCTVAESEATRVHHSAGRCGARLALAGVLTLCAGVLRGSRPQVAKMPLLPSGFTSWKSAVVGAIKWFSVDFAELFRRSYKPVLKVCKFGSSNSPRTHPANESRRSAA